MTTYRSPSPRQDRNLHPRECPYERLAVAPAGDIWEYTDLVIHDTRGRRVSPSLLRARQRLLRCRQMTNSPPWVQASGGLLVSGERRPAANVLNPQDHLCFTHGRSAAPAMPAALRPHRAMVQNSRRWIEALGVITMFPTFVWKVQIEAGLGDALQQRVLAAMTEMRVRLPPLAHGHGWQSEQTLPQRGDLWDLQPDVLVLHRAPEPTALVSEATSLAPPDDPSRGDS